MDRRNTLYKIDRQVSKMLLKVETLIKLNEQKNGRNFKKNGKAEK